MQTWPMHPAHVPSADVHIRCAAHAGVHAVQVIGLFLAQAPPTDLSRPVQLAQGLFVCGDHRDTATLDGALKSGRRAAEAVLAAPAAGSRSQQLVGAEA